MSQERRRAREEYTGLAEGPTPVPPRCPDCNEVPRTGAQLVFGGEPYRAACRCVPPAAYGAWKFMGATWKLWTAKGWRNL